MTRAYETGKWVPKPLAEDARYVVPLAELMAAADRLEVAAVAHADALRRGDERHATITGPDLAHARSQFQEVARRACSGTEMIREVLRGVYDYLVTHHGRRLAVKLRPWLQG